jgi:cell division septal protein FtsQ
MQQPILTVRPTERPRGVLRGVQPGRKPVPGRTPGTLRRRIVRGVLAVLCFLSPVAIGGMAFASPRLAIEEVAVTGNEVVAAEDIQRTAGLEGRNSLTVNAGDVRRALKRLPGVADAEVAVLFPNRVTINVRERQPWAIWQARGGRFVIDEEGSVLRKAGDAEQMFSLNDLENRLLAPGSHVDAAVVRLAMRLSTEFPAQTGVRVQRFEYTEPAGLTVVTANGWRARFGDAANLECKLPTVRAILDAAAQKKLGVETVDVRNCERPYFR